MSKPVPPIVALIAVFNEELILDATLSHLAAQGIGFHILDNGSTDASPEIARSFEGRGLLGWERFPAETLGTQRAYDLADVLRRKQVLAMEYAARGVRWLIHYDADEIRESPWPGVSLFDGLLRVQREGFNAVNHVIVYFVPVDESFTRGCAPTDHFRFYILKPESTRHVKAWIQPRRPVDLLRDGGHVVRFPGRKIYPIPFIIRHYALLSTAHARRKIFLERRPRYSQSGLDRQWHRHYNDRTETSAFVYSTEDPRLTVWDENAFKRELLARPRPSLFERLFPPF